MNRAQRRAADKVNSRARVRRMGRRGYDIAQSRAKAWLVGACYEGVPVVEDRDGEPVHGLSGSWRFPPTVPVSKRESVADYASRSPLRWNITVEAIFRDGHGGEYRHQAGGPIGQTLLLGELADHWRALLEEARHQGNPRHHWADVVRAWPLVSRGGADG